MPHVEVVDGGFHLTRLAWLSAEAVAIQDAAVDLLNIRGATKYKDQYLIRYAL
jgi:hypothetical protein